MKQIVVKTQAEFDVIKEILVNDEVVIECAVRLSGIVEVFGKLIIKASTDCSFSEGRYFRANSSPSIENRENSSPIIVNRENSSPRIVNWANSSPRIENWANSSPSIENRENSSPSIENWDRSILILLSATAKTHIKLFGYALLMKSVDVKVKIEIKSKHAHVHNTKIASSYFDREGIEKTKGNVILYKRVSKNYKTREGLEGETDWVIGTTLTHHAWEPKSEECGKGKYHACSRPYFCDEFRSLKDDRYIAIEVAVKDTYEWKNTSYPHKIAFRKGRVLFECDMFGEKINSKNGTDSK